MRPPARRSRRLAGAAASVLLAALLLPGCRTRAGVGILPYYPGAEVSAVAEADGVAFGFGPARWTRADLKVRAPYERVRDFYAARVPAGWASTFTNETHKPSGRRYDRYLADPRRREFYVVQVREDAGGVVRVTLAWGRLSAR